jgi:hypothetical protein
MAWPASCLAAEPGSMCRAHMVFILSYVLSTLRVRRMPRISTLAARMRFDPTGLVFRPLLRFEIQQQGNHIQWKQTTLKEY